MEINGFGRFIVKKFLWDFLYLIENSTLTEDHFIDWPGPGYPRMASDENKY